MSSTTSSAQDNPSYSFVQWSFIFGCVLAGLGVTTSLGNSIYLAHAKSTQEIKSSEYESLAELAQGSCRGVTYLKSMAQQPILNKDYGPLKVELARIKDAEASNNARASLNGADNSKACTT